MAGGSGRIRQRRSIIDVIGRDPAAQQVRPQGAHSSMTLRDQVARAEYRRRFPGLDDSTVAVHFADFHFTDSASLRRRDRASFRNVENAYDAADSALTVIMPACVAVAEAQRRRHAEAIKACAGSSRARLDERCGLQTAKAIVGLLSSLATSAAPAPTGGEAARLRLALQHLSARPKARQAARPRLTARRLARMVADAATTMFRRGVLLASMSLAVIAILAGMSDDWPPTQG